MTPLPKHGRRLGDALAGRNDASLAGKRQLEINLRLAEHGAPRP